MSRATRILPLAYEDDTPSRQPPGPITRSYLFFRRRPLRNALCFLFLPILILVNLTTIGTIRRDFIYLIRPLWDSPERPFTLIPHYAPPLSGKPAWCALHSWQPRGAGSSRPIIVDAVPISTELDMYEIRMREYAPFVTVFVVVEAGLTHAGQPKPLFFKENIERFQQIASDHGAQLLYREAQGLERDLPVGRFDNEIKQRNVIGSVLGELRQGGNLPPGSLVIQSDVDEIISRQTLDLLSSCHGYPNELHLNVKNYRYGFNMPLNDGGYFRPRVVTIQDDGGAGSGFVNYHHQRASDIMLADAGWHCSFCFKTLDDMRAKMMGYAHNDRLRSKKLLEERVLRDKVCRGVDPFGMWSESFTFPNLIAESRPLAPLSPHTYINIPFALKQYPERWPYLLEGGCERPNHAGE